MNPTHDFTAKVALVTRSRRLSSRCRLQGGR
jgi:hypothetical protein